MAAPGSRHAAHGPGSAPAVHGPESAPAADGPGGAPPAQGSPTPSRLAHWFRECYGREPDLIWHAPGRVNLIGEHTDYNGGLVLPFALARGVLAAVADRGDGLLEVCSRQVPGEAPSVRLDRLQPGGVTGWAAYAAGAAWALRAAGYDVPGASIAVDSDLPVGAGLSSSAALCCAVVSALAALAARAGARMPPRTEIAAIARSAEADYVGMPCGIMDQSASMLGEAGHALLLDCGSGESSLVPIDPAATGLQVVMADTGVRHALADGQYAARREQCRQAAELLGVTALREVTDVSALSALPDPVLLRRARHVVSETRRVAQAAALLRAGRLAECGAVLTASHASLRDDFEVSWPAADRAVASAMSAGALGARMTGGGFGGCVLVLLPADRYAAVTEAIRCALADRAAEAGDWFLTAEPAPGAREVWPSR
jgi:galactokinase